MAHTVTSNMRFISRKRDWWEGVMPLLPGVMFIMDEEEEEP